jgi:uncharacterized protein (DUF488 family)
MHLFTIGHSAHPSEKFINLLKYYHIQMLVDVRSIPASRYHPQYNKAAIEKVLTENHIIYVFAGQQLGGRPKDPKLYDPEMIIGKENKHPKANYSLIMKHEWFIQGIANLIDHVSKKQTAILCSEEDPLRCHRHELISMYIMKEFPNVEIQHIRGNGTLISASYLFDACESKSSTQISLL